MEEKILLFVMMVITIILGAIGDASNDNNKKEIGHLFNAINIMVLLFIGYYFNNLIIFPIYLCFRIAIFDIAYNIISGLSWNYIGNSNYWDKFFRLFSNSNKFQPTMNILFRLIFLVIGTHMVFVYYN